MVSSVVVDAQTKPLAARVRPRTIDEYIGQSHLLGEGKPIRVAFERSLLHSMILWGPPGTGKTTLARLIANRSNANFVSLSAVLSGVKDIRDVVAKAKLALEIQQKPTILFVDEIHRFNKSQQDAFLPHIEEGIVTLIGATTENPSFELNNALLSRARVYVLKPLSQQEMLQVLEQALTSHRGYGDLQVLLSDEVKNQLVQVADGDARLLLNILETAVDDVVDENSKAVITEKILSNITGGSLRRFDKNGEYFYDLISALHKSVRGSNPHAALYWFARMIDGGCDPLYIARRVVRMASEDIGNADPRALELSLNALQVQERLGSPEGHLALAQAISYLASAAKSNAVYAAFDAAMAEVKSSGSLEVPIHLRNASTKLMKQLGYGKAYRYAHNEPHAYAAGEDYFPSQLSGREYYHPVNRGLEKKIAEKLAFLKQLDEQGS